MSQKVKFSECFKNNLKNLIKIFDKNEKNEKSKKNGRINNIYPFWVVNFFFVGDFPHKS